MTQEAKCPECGRWYDIYDMYVGPQNICQSCRSKRDAEKRESAGKPQARP